MPTALILVRTRNPLNIGAVARAMSNFGLSDLRLVQPYEPSFREARSAVGAAELLATARVFDSLHDAIADCHFVVGTTAATNRELAQSLVSLDLAAVDIQKELARGRIALLFGSEKTGLSTSDLNHCHLVTRIPTRTAHGSMNLGQAVAIYLYALSRSTPCATTDPPADAPRPTFAQLERLHSLFYEALLAAGYVKPNTEASVADSLRHLLQRLTLGVPDTELLTGMLRKLRDALTRSSHTRG
ncbi:MAG: RNA methyltransferase [Acidobacteriaceae bacterium]